jgi:hypothetical protein
LQTGSIPGSRILVKLVKKEEYMTLALWMLGIHTVIQALACGGELHKPGGNGWAALINAILCGLSGWAWYGLLVVSIVTL